MLTLLAAALLASPQPSDISVHIRGTDIAVRCLGTRRPDAPLVVLEAGGGNGMDVWSLVQAPISEFARVCAYDRPTLIRGNVGPRAGSSPDEVVQTLLEVLAALHEDAPYVMVAHSYGGMIVRLYATTYPAEVAGLVLIDSSHEDQLARFEAIDPKIAQELRSPASDEAVDLVAFSTVLNAHRWRSTIPLAVLTRSRKMPAPPGREATNEALDRVYVIASQSGHYIHRDEPGLVIEAVRHVVSGAQRQSPGCRLG